MRDIEDSVEQFAAAMMPPGCPGRFALVPALPTPSPGDEGAGSRRERQPGWDTAGALFWRARNEACDDLVGTQPWEM
ncbi:hypothetical protein [Nocardia sp. NBC_00403]|uniref:hypothetical protein n=1 Tax=Nocardia sp. NBC_00403 TaxID=2975990 RepID=UPI002E1C7B3C